MFVDLEMFVSEREGHFRRLQEINNGNTDENIKNSQLKEEEDRYKNSIRKYLSVSINTINEVYPFSLYKIGKDMDAKFHVIETKVRRGKREIMGEFEAKQNLALNLDPKKKRQFDIAMQVIVDYSDDLVENEERNAFLNGR